MSSQTDEAERIKEFLKQIGEQSARNIREIKEAPDDVARAKATNRQKRLADWLGKVVNGEE
ncbi:MAG: hypothetical protein HOO96_42320 [Polyangiaceae bacterium]|nr:hypothetical protein [Polyangiaceae bacterium]